MIKFKWGHSREPKSDKAGVPVSWRDISLPLSLRHVQTQWEGGHGQAERQHSARTQPGSVWSGISQPPASTRVRNKHLFFKPPRLWHCFTACILIPRTNSFLCMFQNKYSYLLINIILHLWVRQNWMPTAAGRQTPLKSQWPHQHYEICAFLTNKSQQ